jgi:hypothetical protein
LLGVRGLFVCYLPAHIAGCAIEPWEQDLFVDSHAIEFLANGAVEGRTHYEAPNFVRDLFERKSRILPDAQDRPLRKDALVAEVGDKEVRACIVEAPGLRTIAFPDLAHETPFTVSAEDSGRTLLMPWISASPLLRGDRKIECGKG